MTEEPTPTDSPAFGDTPTPTPTEEVFVVDFDIEPQEEPDGIVDDADLIMWYKEVCHGTQEPQLLFEFSMHWMENKKVSKEKSPKAP